MARSSPLVHSVTTARRSRSEDQRSRYIQYLVAMSIRMVCLVAAVFVHGPLVWVCIVGAVVLPYVAVVLANATNYAIGTIDNADPDDSGHPRVEPHATRVLAGPDDRGGNDGSGRGPTSRVVTIRGDEPDE